MVDPVVTTGTVSAEAHERLRRSHTALQEQLDAANEVLAAVGRSAGDTGLALAAPSAAYLHSIATGLREAHGWDDARIATYLAAAPGARESWTPASVLEALAVRG